MRRETRMKPHPVRYMLLLLMCVFPLLTASADNVNNLLQVFGEGKTDDNRQIGRQLLAYFQKEGIADETLKNAETLHPDTLRQQVWYWSAEYFYDRQQYENAVEYALKALPLCHVGDDRNVEGACLNLLAISNIRLGYYQRAAKYAKLCNQLDMESGDPENISSSLNTLAAIYLAARQPHEAEKYVLKGIHECQKTDNKTRLAVLYGMACEVYNAQENFEKGLSYAEQACTLEQELGDTDKMAIRLSQKAASLIGLGQMDKAMALLQKAIPVFRKNGNRQSLGISCNQMGRLLLKGDRRAEAVRYYQEAADIFTALGDSYGESHARQGLYYALKTTDPQRAMENIDRYNVLKDSLYANATSEQLARFHEEFSVDELQAATESARRNNYVILAIALGLILLLVGLAWWLMHRQNHHNATRYESLASDLEQIREEHRQLQGYYSNAIVASRPEADTLSEHDKQFLERTAILLNEQLKGGNPSIEMLAAELGMSGKQFSRRLKDLTGDSPKEYLLQMRMQKARHLLDQHPELTIGEVAYRCGYEEKANFTRAFKRHFGVTPSNYAASEKACAETDAPQESVDELASEA